MSSCRAAEESDFARAEEARVPVIGHLEGVCHVYVHRDADLDDVETHRVECENVDERVGVGDNCRTNAGAAREF